MATSHGKLTADICLGEPNVSLVEAIQARVPIQRRKVRKLPLDSAFGKLPGVQSVLLCTCATNPVSLDRQIARLHVYPLASSSRLDSLPAMLPSRFVSATLFSGVTGSSFLSGFTTFFTGGGVRPTPLPVFWVVFVGFCGMVHIGLGAREMRLEGAPSSCRVCLEITRA